MNNVSIEPPLTRSLRSQDFHPGDDPAGCLARAEDWRYFQKDGKWFARETNTMPQWAGSCWYYLRYTDPKNNDQAWSEKADKVTNARSEATSWEYDSCVQNEAP